MYVSLVSQMSPSAIQDKMENCFSCTSGVPAMYITSMYLLCFYCVGYGSVVLAMPLYCLLWSCFAYQYLVVFASVTVPAPLLFCNKPIYSAGLVDILAKQGEDQWGAHKSTGEQWKTLQTERIPPPTVVSRVSQPLRGCIAILFSGPC